MRQICEYLKSINLWVILILAILIGGCIEEKETSDTIFSIKKGEKQAPHTPITIIMTVSGPLELNKVSDITINVSSISDAPDTKVDLILPEGVLLESEKSTWQLNLTANNPVILYAKIKITKNGTLEIRTVAKKIIDENNTWGDIDAIYAVQSVTNITDAKRST